MADPSHVPSLDAFDRLTVRLYRSGLIVAALGLLGAAGAQALAPELARPLWVVVAAGAAAAAADMHLYDKRVRWVIGAAGWLGLVLIIGSAQLPELAQHWVFHAGLGFVFVTLSGFAVKEQFCFRIPGLRFVPLFLAVAVFGLVGGAPTAMVVALLTVAGGLYLVLSIAKLRMPLHFDVGDKSKYQV